MRYVYGCTQNPAHPRQEVIHGMFDSIRVCCTTCGAEMRRIPQPFIWGHKPFDTLYEHMEKTLTRGRK